MATYLSWPLRVGPDGRFGTATSPEEVWSNRMAQLLCARMGERAMRIDYGTTVANAIFENALDDPEGAIRAAVSKWLPYLVVDKVQIVKEQDTYQITVTYTTPEKELLTTTVGLAVPGEGA